jgi:hypothetical protein
MFDEFFSFAAEVERDVIGESTTPLNWDVGHVPDLRWLVTGAHEDLHSQSQRRSTPKGTSAAEDSGAASGRSLWFGGGPTRGNPVAFSNAQPARPPLVSRVL